MNERRIVFWEVDAQEDFMLPGGKLYVPGAEKIIPNIQRLVKAAVDAHALLVSSGDAHPEGDPEFGTFPPHCLRGTQGARIVPEGMAGDFCTIPNDSDFQFPENILNYPQLLFEKQTLNVFDNPHAGAFVDKLDPRAEFVVFGVVTEYCVLCAVRGLLERGRQVLVVKDAIQSLAPPREGQRALDEMRGLGAGFITTDEAIARLSAESAGAAPVR